MLIRPAHLIPKQIHERRKSRFLKELVVRALDATIKKFVDLAGLQKLDRLFIFFGVELHCLHFDDAGRDALGRPPTFSFGTLLPHSRRVDSRRMGGHSTRGSGTARKPSTVPWKVQRPCLGMVYQVTFSLAKKEYVTCFAKKAKSGAKWPFWGK